MEKLKESHIHAMNASGAITGFKPSRGASDNPSHIGTAICYLAIGIAAGLALGLFLAPLVLMR